MASSPTESGWIVFLPQMPGILLKVLPQNLQESCPIQAEALSSRLPAYCAGGTASPVPPYGTS